MEPVPVRRQQLTLTVGRLTFDNTSLFQKTQKRSLHLSRQNYNQAMAEIERVLKDANQNDVPDILEGIVPDRSKPSPSPAMPQPDPATMHPRPGATPHVVTGTTPGVGLLLIGGVIVILIAVIVGYVVLMVFQQG